MAELVFPSLPGLGWSVMKAPRFASRIQKAVSGRELRIVDQPLPIWLFTLTFPILRDKHDTRGPAGWGGLYDELRTLAGFFLQMQGQFATFLFDDPTDDSVLGQSIGTGDAGTTVFQLVRTFGGFVEPVTAPNAVTAIYFNGIIQSAASWSVDPATGIVTFTAPPPAGRAITADLSYYFRCRFAEDSNEFDNFNYQKWSLKQLKFQSVIGLK